MKHAIPILLALLSFGCINRQSSNIPAAPETTDIGHPINYDSTEVIKTVYALDRSGLQARQDPDAQSTVLATYEYGDRLEVIEDTPEYYGIRERITRRFEEQTKTIVSNGWEKIYIPKAQTGSFDRIELCAADLNIIGALSENTGAEMRSTSYDEPRPLNGYLAIELIDKQTFETKKSTAVNFLTADTTAIVKNEGKILLPCAHTSVEYADCDSDGETRAIYTYLGQIAPLDAYVVEGSYYENWDHQLIYKADGTATSMVGYPHLSPDQQHIVCIKANPYESIADVEVYTVRGHKPEGLVFTSFANWMPVEPESGVSGIFWSSDDCLYLPVNHSKAYWTPNGSYNDRHQYLRIRITTPDQSE